MKRGLTSAILLTLFSIGFLESAVSNTGPKIELLEPVSGSLVDPESAFTITFKVTGPGIGDSSEIKFLCDTALKGVDFYIGQVDALGITKWLSVRTSQLRSSDFESKRLDGEVITCTYAVKSIWGKIGDSTVYSTQWNDGYIFRNLSGDALVSKYGGSKWESSGAKIGPVVKVSIGWQKPQDSNATIVSFKADPTSTPEPSPSPTPKREVTFSTKMTAKPPANVKWGKSFNLKIATLGTGGATCEMYFQNPGWPSQKGVVRFRLQAGSTTTVTVKPWIRVFASYSLKYACVPDGWPMINSDRSISLYDKRISVDLGNVTLTP